MTRFVSSVRAAVLLLAAVLAPVAVVAVSQATQADAVLFAANDNGGNGGG